MSTIYHEIIAANGYYAYTFGVKGKLGLAPVRRFAILTCMDARLDVVFRLDIRVFALNVALDVVCGFYCHCAMTLGSSAFPPSGMMSLLAF